MSATAPSVLEPLTDGSVLNVAAYRFVKLDNLERRRKSLRDRGLELGLRGTILLSLEGINLFLAGPPPAVETFLEELRLVPELTDLEAKYSYSDKVPFRRMIVRLKKEIIPFGINGIQPEQKTSPKLPAPELKQWLDEGRPVRLLDVRNDYEIEMGTFRSAEQLNLHHFRDFPEAIKQLPEEAKSEPVVMFCTGGIRCEKAGPLMEEAGFQQIYQLDGGILKYFELCGGAHYDGSCFVFDGRVALDSQLQPTGNLLCFACQAVLSAEDVTSGKFLFGEYCPRCYREPVQVRQEQFSARRQAILDVAARQPGSTPYDNLRKIHVPGRYAGYKLIDFLDDWQPAVGRSQWLEWLDAGHIVNHGVCVPDQQVREGERFIQYMPDTVEPQINPCIDLLHEDESLIVVNKPAPLPCHPSGRFNRNTLAYLLGRAYSNEKLRVAHRLDANTTGVTLLCRKYRASRLVQPQFSSHQVEKTYLARVHGHPQWQSLTCDAPIGEAPSGAAGSRIVDPQGLPAVTHFRVLEQRSDGTALVEAIPQSGRTHQIRLHLQHVGHAVVGDPLYLPGGGVGNSQTLPFSAPPMCLHSQSLTLIHPDSGESVTYEAAPPDWV